MDALDEALNLIHDLGAKTLTIYATWGSICRSRKKIKSLRIGRSHRWIQRVVIITATDIKHCFTFNSAQDLQILVSY